MVVKLHPQFTEYGSQNWPTLSNYQAEKIYFSFWLSPNQLNISKASANSINSVQKLKTSAFSLIELSIVLVIMGLLISGLIGGKALIDSSKVVSLSNELNQFTVAVNAFNLKYDAYPGDYNKASTRIRSDLENGNGDGYIGYYDPDNLASLENWSFILDNDKTLESRMFFAHLFAAKILNQQDSGALHKLFSLPTALASSASSNNTLSGRIVHGYYRSKPFPEAVLFPRVDAGSNYANAINSMVLVNTASLTAALNSGVVEIGKLTAVLSPKTLLKLKHKLAEDSSCRSGDCLVSGNIYIHRLDQQETESSGSNTPCIIQSSSGELVLNTANNARKCTLGFSITNHETLIAIATDGANYAQCDNATAPAIADASVSNNTGFTNHNAKLSYTCNGSSKSISISCKNGVWQEPAETCSSGVTFKIFDTATKTSWKVPAGVTSVKLYVWGAGGATENRVENYQQGGYTAATLAVTPEQQLYIWVGNQSTEYGGGSGGSGSNGQGFHGGGFSSIVTDANATLGNVIGVIAGGGGGGSNGTEMIFGGGAGGGNNNPGWNGDISNNNGGSNGRGGIATATTGGDSGQNGGSIPDASGGKGGYGGGGGGGGQYYKDSSMEHGGGGGGGGYGGGGGAKGEGGAGGGAYCGGSDISGCTGSDNTWPNATGRAAIAWGDASCNPDGTCSQ